MLYMSKLAAALFQVLREFSKIHSRNNSRLNFVTVQHIRGVVLQVDTAHSRIL